MKDLRVFLITTFVKQNKWHRHGVLVHTLKVAYQAIRAGRYDFVAAALLHDVGKPFVAYQDEKDITLGTYSFTNHEEASYHIIKDWGFVSDYTKQIVRNHYLIRGMRKAQEKGLDGRYRRLRRIYDRLTTEEIEDLVDFMRIDDLGKI